MTSTSLRLTPLNSSSVIKLIISINAGLAAKRLHGLVSRGNLLFESSVQIRNAFKSLINHLSVHFYNRWREAWQASNEIVEHLAAGSRARVGIGGCPLGMQHNVNYALCCSPSAFAQRSCVR